MRHYDEDELATYALDPTAVSDRLDLEQHIRDCSECRDVLKAIETFDSALRETTPWLVLDELVDGHSPSVASLIQFAEELDLERAHARELLLPLTISPVEFKRAVIEDDRSFHTTGVVRVLTETAEELRQRQPQFALTVADAAVSIATKLLQAGMITSSALLGGALRERAIALHLMGRFREATDAIQRSEQAFDSDPRSTAHDAAIVWLIRANICIETERLSEAQFLADAAGRQFLEFGDTSRYLNSQLVAGCLLHMRRQYRDAAALLEKIISVARRENNRLALARALQNAADSYGRFAEYGKAVPYFVEALALWDELGFELEKVRSNWGLASILVSTGEIETGINQLADVRDRFEALGADNDAALVRLELSEALIVADRTDEVLPLLRDVVMTFASEGMMRNANLALAYLREAVAAGRGDAKLLRRVRSYLEELPAKPQRPFNPLQ